MRTRRQELLPFGLADEEANQLPQAVVETVRNAVAELLLQVASAVLEEEANDDRR
ncbi:hypothetical protein JYT15_01135 [Acidimicrobium ferrooxidans]|nr:hypothetical protein [Acidimicrobium ferrooxidans]